MSDRAPSLVVGAGAVGARAARQLASTDGVEVARRTTAAPSRAAAGRRRPSATGAGRRRRSRRRRRADVAVLATPPAPTPPLAAALLRARRRRSSRPPTTSTTSAACSTSTPRPRERGRRRRRRRRLLARASPACSPRHAADALDRVDEVHVARAGTGGPACARQHHRALGRGAARLARRRLGAPLGRLGPRAVLVPRPDRRARLLPGRRCPSRCCSSGPSRASTGSPPASPPTAATG